MILKEFWVKPNRPYVKSKWPGPKGSDIPGPDNFGTHDNPVEFSAGAVSEWIYEPNFTSPGPELYKYVIHFVAGPDSNPPVFYVGPEQYQGSTCIYLQRNPKRTNHSISVTLTAPENKIPILLYTARNYTEQQVSQWKGGVEDSVIRSAPINLKAKPMGDLFEINLENLIIDANFRSHGYAAEEGSKTRGYKIMGYQLRASRGTVRNVKILGCGANSDVIGGSLLAECFPANIYSYDTVPSDPPPWLVENCEINGFTSVNGGYATGFSVNPFTSVPEKLPVTFYDAAGTNRATKFCCIVRNCRVIGTPVMNGLGASGSTAEDGALASNYVLFENNVVMNCGLGANQDTAGIRYIHFVGNTFVNCNAMVQLGTPTGSMVNGKLDPNNPTFHRNFIVEGNTLICLRNDARLSKAYPDRVKGAGLILRNNSAGISYRDNVIVPVSEDRFCAWDAGMDEYQYRMICPSSVDPYFTEYYGSAGPGVTCSDDWSDPERTKGSVCITRPRPTTPFERMRVLS